MKRTLCLHKGVLRKAYGEQREREMRSISSLCLYADMTKYAPHFESLLIRGHDEIRGHTSELIQNAPHACKRTASPPSPF